MRLFVGIPLAAEVSSELAAMARRLACAAEGLRWTAPASWHITLEFLGNSTREQCACVVKRLRALHQPPVPITLEKLDIFDRAGVLILTVRPTPELLRIAERVRRATGPCGFAAESRPYQPHITLARGKGRDGGARLAALRAKISRQPRFNGFTAREFLLYESFLAPAGSRYEVRERFALDEA
ncbi:MAG: RNA 2',3'-cyclic phosphodiesterase [Terracidiphilus sp.]